MQTIQIWLAHYGYIAIFFLLALGIIGLPIPDEILTITVGLLVAKGKLMLFPSLGAIYLGAIFGITASYLLGYSCGHFVLEKYGYIFKINQARLIKAHRWFEKIGKWALFFGYFILGVRHLTGISAGMTELSYRQFAAYAYSGAIVWATTFFSIGYYFSRNWQLLLNYITTFEIIVSIILFVVVIIYYVNKRKNRQPKN